MKESGRTTSVMARGRRIGRMALRTMVSVGLVQNHDCFISFRLMRVVDLHKGSFVEGTREGFGKYVSAARKDNKQNGKGKEKWLNGDTYEGECRGGVNHDCFPVVDACC